MTVILAVCESDTHVVANQLIQWTLENHGVCVHNLGACVPVKAICAKVEELDHQVDAILIGSLNGHAVNDLRALAKFEEQLSGIPVIVGGNLSIDVTKLEQVHQQLYDFGVDMILKTIDDILPALIQIKQGRKSLINFR